MVELVSFITGSVFLFFAIKILLFKVFFDIGKTILLHPISLTIILLVVLGMLFMPDIISPYLNATITYFVNGVTSIFTWIWGIVETMFNSLI